MCLLLSHVQLFETPWTVACQAPLSMGFSRQECWLNCHSFLQRIFPMFSPFICYYWGIPGGLGQRVLRRHSLILLMSVFSLAGAFLIGPFLRSLGLLLYRSLFKSRCSLKMKSPLYGHLQLSPCCLLSSLCSTTTGHSSHSQTLEWFLKTILI